MKNVTPKKMRQGDEDDDPPPASQASDVSISSTWSLTSSPPPPMSLNPAKHSLDFQQEVVICRGLALLIVLFGLWWYDNLNYLVSLLWAFLRKKWWFQHDSFEPILASSCFFVYINLFRVVDCMSSRKILRYRIQKTQDMSAWTRSRDRMGREMLGYLLPLLAFDYFFPRRRLPEDPPALAQLLVEVVATVNLYDVFFFFSHILLHKNRQLYTMVHARHHTMSAVRACEAVRHTFVDGSLNVACSVLALNLVGSHPLSRAAHNIVLIYLLVELHAGYDMPWMLHNICPLELIGGPPRHDDHHRYGYCYYQKFGTYLDRAFGFEMNRHRCGDGTNALCCYYQQVFTNKNND